MNIDKPEEVADYISGSLTRDVRNKNISINRMSRTAINLTAENCSEGGKSVIKVSYLLGENQQNCDLVVVTVDCEEKTLTVKKGSSNSDIIYRLDEYAKALCDARRSITCY